MKSHEFMVGNTVFDSELDEVVETDHSDFEFPYYLNPVPFDDTWCRGFGMVDVMGGEIWEMKYVSRLDVLMVFRAILLEGGGAWVVIEIDGSKNVINPGLNLGEYKFVHEVQVLFYSLASRPLQVPPKPQPK